MLDAFKKTDDCEASQEFPEFPFRNLNPEDSVRGESGSMSIGWSLPRKGQKHRGVTGSVEVGRASRERGPLG